MAGQRPRPGPVNEPRFAPSEIAAVLCVGVVGVLIPGLQPQLLGALAHEGRLSVVALGNLATLELLAMGVAAGGTGLLLSIDKLRSIAAIALVTTAILDMVSPLAADWRLFAVRGMAGLAEGVLIWVAIGFIVRTTNPGRWSGLYLMIQTLAQLTLATLFGLWVIPIAGSAGGWQWLGVATLVALAALPWLPRAYPPLDHGSESTGLPPARGLVALTGVLLYLAFVVAVWVYVEPLGSQLGVDRQNLSIVTPLALAMQVLGAGAATLLAGRVPALPVLLLVGAINLVLLAAMGTIGSPAAFVTASAVFGFLWLFAMPFQIPLVIAADPSRRAAGLVGGAQLVGSSAGPFVAALLVGESDVRPVLWFGATCIVASLALMAAVVLHRGAAARNAM